MIKDTDLALRWFSQPNNVPQSFLTPEGVLLVDEIKTALSSHAFDAATRLSLHLFYLSNMPRLEVGEILLRTAIHAVELQDEESLLFAKDQGLRAAEAFINHDGHCRALAMWFVGYIFWQIPVYRREALHHWERSRRLLTWLSYAHYSPYPAWYQQVLFVVAESLLQTKMREAYFPLMKVKYLHLRPAPQPSPSKNVSPKPKSSSRLVFRTIPVYQYVPAGGWGVVDPDEVGQLNVEKMMIDDVPHRAIDLLGRGQITLQEREQYALVRIKGTSMNKLDIQEGDYVLIRRQEDANHTDIVLAERIGLDAEATLKRFHKQGNTLALRPESHDPHPVLLVDRREKLRILGIGIAVLKPIPSE
ncbi:MAG: hypothetical protein Fur0022_37030 [Anaerolineales bacterium]